MFNEIYGVFQSGECLAPECSAVALHSVGETLDEGCSTEFQNCGKTACYQQALHHTVAKGEMGILPTVLQLVNFLQVAAGFNPYFFFCK